MNINKLSHILMIDDGNQHCIEIVDALTLHGYTVHVVYLYQEAFSILKTITIETVLLPINQEVSDVFTFLDSLITDEDYKYIPIVALLDTEQAEHVSFVERLLHSGITDYLTLPCIPPLLLHRIKHVANVKQKNINLRELATKDDLTWLVNRKTFCKQSQSLISQQVFSGHHDYSILLFNIVHLKKINEQYGHKTGDDILSLMASFLIKTFDSSTVVSRLYSDTFAVCVPFCKVESTISMAKAFIRDVEQYAFPVADRDHEFTHITVKGGLSSHYKNSIAPMINDIELTMAQITDDSDKKFVEYVPKHKGILRNNESMKENVTIQKHLINETTSNQPPLLPGIDITEGMNNVLNDEALFYEVLFMFFQDHGDDANKLIQAFENEDMVTLKHVVHTLKGVSGSIAATELHIKAKILDDAINFENQEKSVLILYLNNIEQELLLVIRGIIEALKTKPSLLA